jgi:hypothetical protein
MKLEQLRKSVVAGKADCIRRAKHSRAIQDAASKAERRSHEAQSKSHKYASQQQKSTMRHERSLQDLERARFRKESGLRSPAQNAAIGVGVLGALGAAAYFMFAN